MVLKKSIKTIKAVLSATIGPTVDNLKGKFATGSIPLQADFGDLIDIADCGRKAIGQSPGQSDNNPGIGIALDDSGKITVKAGAGIKVDASGVSFDFSKSMPSGIVLMFSGTAAIPDGWALCDGTNGTPDLRSRFVLGGDPEDTGAYNDATLSGGTNAGKDYSVSVQTDVQTPTVTTTLSFTALTVDQLPPHQHVIAGANNEYYRCYWNYYSHVSSPESGVQVALSGYSDDVPGTQAEEFVARETGSGAPHSHTATSTQFGHSHKVSVDIPYYVLRFIMKI